MVRKCIFLEKKNNQRRFGRTYPQVHGVGILQKVLLCTYVGKNLPTKFKNLS